VSNVLVITHEPLRRNLSGPGVRALEMARSLAERHDVTVAAPFPPEIADDRCALVEYSFDRPSSLKALAERSAVLIVQGFTLSQFPFLGELPAAIVVDLYCPFTVENLEMVRSRRKHADLSPGELEAIDADAAAVLAVQNTQLAVGDFFLCASERQRDFWIGALHSAGRINPRTYAVDPTLRALIDVVPFGLPDQPPRESRLQPAVMKGVLGGIGPDDHIVLWAGSMLDWQDPQAAVRAIASISGRRTDIKLFFMGTRHPNPVVPEMRAVHESISLARDLGVLDTFVFFNEWVPYSDRWRYLIEADIGLSTHHDHLETRLSFRTRMLDYMWAGLPIVCTEGDVFASLVTERKLGLVVRAGDVGELESSIERLIDEKDERVRCRTRLLEVAKEFQWRRVVAPVARFCDAPRVAADRESSHRALYLQIARSFRLMRWLKRVALRAGVTEARIQQAKGLMPVRMTIDLLNRRAIARARKDLIKRGG
jgi:glycosyltransferase involved in cell wall biosynthesis